MGKDLLLVNQPGKHEWLRYGDLSLSFQKDKQHRTKSVILCCKGSMQDTVGEDRSNNNRGKLKIYSCSQLYQLDQCGIFVRNDTMC